MSSFIRVPLFAAVAALTLTGCNMSKDCCCKTPQAAAPAKPTQVSTGGSTATAPARPAKPRKAHRPSHPRDRYEGGYRYARTGGGYVAGSGGRTYAGSSVSVTETETASSGYRYSETTERYGSGGGYASTGGGYVAPPPPTAGTPVYHPGYALAGVDRNGYLTWPGKVQ